MVDIERMLSFDEGKKLKVYKCSQGFLTVGVGHNLQANKALEILKRHLSLGDSITEEECSKLFIQDLNNVYAGIKREMPWFDKIKDKYKPVIINMIFQMGINGVLNFKGTLKYIQEDKPNEVINHMKNSRWYQQTPNRVERLIKLIQEVNVPEYN